MCKCLLSTKFTSTRNAEKRFIPWRHSKRYIKKLSSPIRKDPWERNENKTARGSPERGASGTEGRHPAVFPWLYRQWGTSVGQGRGHEQVVIANTSTRMSDYSPLLYEDANTSA